MNVYSKCVCCSGTVCPVNTVGVCTLCQRGPWHIDHCMDHCRIHNCGGIKITLIGDQVSERPKRISWDKYFLDIAKTVSSRSTCERRRVGAVFVRERNTLATGYNGSISGTAHCDDIGHDVEETDHASHCVRTIHAEVNAIIQGARHGVRLKNSILYCTDCPCWHCFRCVANLGVKRIVYSREYKQDRRMIEAALQLGIRLEKG